MNLKIITGLSGAGKSTVIRKMEDLGYYCIDNLPPALLNPFLELCSHANPEIKNVAIGIDARGKEFFDVHQSELIKFIEDNSHVEVIYLEADDNTLIERFKETRRTHPLNPDGAIIDGIKLEKEKMLLIRKVSNYIINTSDFNTRSLAKYIGDRFDTNLCNKKLTLVFQSFGYKNGLPLDSDLVFDVRFLPNPHYIKELRPMSGKDEPIVKYVFESGEAQEFFDKLASLLDFLIPKYLDEDKSQLVISIGCTGGQHRSVAIVEKLCKYYSSLNYNTLSMHRDIRENN